LQQQQQQQQQQRRERDAAAEHPAAPLEVSKECVKQNAALQQKHMEGHPTLNAKLHTHARLCMQAGLCVTCV
jgi:hypothetical protein